VFLLLIETNRPVAHQVAYQQHCPQLLKQNSSSGAVEGLFEMVVLCTCQRNVLADFCIEWFTLSAALLSQITGAS
jgi:hypothetical protein